MEERKWKILMRLTMRLAKHDRGLNSINQSSLPMLLAVLQLLIAFLRASSYIDQLLSIMEEHNVKIPEETIQ